MCPPTLHPGPKTPNSSSSPKPQVDLHAGETHSPTWKTMSPVHNELCLSQDKAQCYVLGGGLLSIPRDPN